MRRASEFKGLDDSAKLLADELAYATDMACTDPKEAQQIANPILPKAR
jgi:hypothetical protein